MKEKEFITKWTTSLTEDGIRKFPDDFTKESKVEKIELPGKSLVIGEEFFGSFEVLTIDGTAVMQADSQSKAKFIVYSSRNKITKLNIPENPEEVKSSVSNYENYLDTIIKEIEADYKKTFPGEKRGNALVNEIFRVLNLNRY
ncbi:MAG: hypothetical protein WB996_05775 [Ignavibacteriaceae bacterium]